MLEAVGRPVERLLRTRVGPIDLGALPAGEWREAGPEERRALGYDPDANDDPR
jgi:23S rRNA pseudouridine2605 synthase